MKKKKPRQFKGPKFKGVLELPDGSRSTQKFWTRADMIEWFASAPRTAAPMAWKWDKCIGFTEMVEEIISARAKQRAITTA